MSDTTDFDEDDPSAIEEEAFLAGPDAYADWLEHGDDELLDIDDIFGKELDAILEDARRYGPHDLNAIEDAPLTPSRRATGYSFMAVEAGVLLLTPDGAIAGAYLGADLSVHPAHRGRGLGAELVLERYLRNGDLPTWWLDSPAYTRAGLAAHKAAWRLLKSPDFLALKLEDLARGAGEPGSRDPNKHP